MWIATCPALSGGNICVIGDPNQAIYGFRGADASCFDRFKRDHPAAKVVRLARNYRSSGTIVTASAQVINAREQKPLADMVRDMHERIAIETAPGERAEAASVVETIERMIGGVSFFALDSGRSSGATEQDLAFSDFAVLYRTDAQSAALVDAFERSGIPYKKNSHGALADEPAVRALLQMLDESVGGNGHNLALTLSLQIAAEELESRDDAFDSFAIRMALARLATLAITCGHDRARLRDAVALATDADFFDPRADRVSLLTLHAAKGLEFPVVFIVGLEDGILPLRWDEGDEAAMAEERRLFYVGMTRAKDRLVLSRARQRLWRGRLRSFEPSPFLSDIENELVKHRRLPTPRRKPEDRQLSLL